MKRSKVAHHTLILILLISVNGLSMLTKIIQARELFATMAGKGAFSCMFPDMPSQMFTPREDHPTFTVTPALESFGGRWSIFSIIDCSRG
jgi:hypothetical protein